MIMASVHASFLSSDDGDAAVSTAASDCEERETRMDCSGVEPSVAVVGLWRTGRFKQLCDEGIRRRRGCDEAASEPSAAAAAAAAAEKEAAAATKGGRMEMARARRPSVRRSSPRKAATSLTTSPHESDTVLPTERHRKMNASTSTCHSRHVGSHAMQNSTHALYAWNTCTPHTTHSCPVSLFQFLLLDEHVLVYSSLSPGTTILCCTNKINEIA